MCMWHVSSILQRMINKKFWLSGNVMLLQTCKELFKKVSSLHSFHFICYWDKDCFLYQGVNMFISIAGTLTWASWALTCRISLKWPFKELVFGTKFSSLLTPELLTWFIRGNIHVTYKQVSHPDCKQIEFIHSLPMAVIQYLCRRANM